MVQRWLSALFSGQLPGASWFFFGATSHFKASYNYHLEIIGKYAVLNNIIKHRFILTYKKIIRFPLCFLWTYLLNYTPH